MISENNVVIQDGYRMLHDNDSSIRAGGAKQVIECINPMGEDSGRKAVEKFAAATLKDPAPIVRKTVLEMLPDYGVSRKWSSESGKYEITCSNALLIVIIDTMKSDKSELVREAAAKALGKLNNSNAVPALIERLTAETDDSVRTQIVQSIGNIADNSAIEVLQTADGSSKFKFFANIAVQKIQKREAERIAQNQLPSPKVARQTVQKRPVNAGAQFMKGPGKQNTPPPAKQRH